MFSKSMLCRNILYCYLVSLICYRLCSLSWKMYFVGWWGYLHVNYSQVKLVYFWILCSLPYGTCKAHVFTYVQAVVRLDHVFALSRRRRPDGAVLRSYSLSTVENRTSSASPHTHGWVTASTTLTSTLFNCCLGSVRLCSDFLSETRRSTWSVLA